VNRVVTAIGDGPGYLHRTDFPWESLVISSILTISGLSFLGVKEPGEGVAGDVFASSIVLLIAAVAGFFRPRVALETFLSAQVPLYLLANSGVVGNAMFSYISFVLAASYTLRKYLQDREFSPFPGTWIAVGLLGVAALQWTRSSQMSDTFPVLLDFASFALVFFTFGCSREFDVRRLCLCYFLGMAASSVFILASEFALEVRLGVGLGLNPNYFGHMGGLGLLLGLLIPVRPRLRVVKYVACALLSVLVVLTESRMAVYGVVVSVVIASIIRRDYRQFSMVLLLALVSILVVSRADLEDYHSATYRLVSPFTEHIESSGAMRGSIWEYMLDILKDNWIEGVGMGNIPLLSAEEGLIIYGKGLQSHNIYLTLLIEYGIAGFLLAVLWQVRILVGGIALKGRGGLLVAVSVYLIMEGFFSGLNLNFIAALMILVAVPAQASARLT